MIATFAFILLLAQVTTATEKTFTDYIIDDIEYDYWALDEIRDFLDSDIIDGYMEDDGENKVLYILPDNQITRAEMAAVIVRAFEESIPFSNEQTIRYQDIDSTHWAFDEVNKASSMGIVKGKSTNLFKPNDLASRAEAIVMIHRALNS